MQPRMDGSKMVELIKGRVQWQFTLQWGQADEKFLSRSAFVEGPWWSTSFKKYLLLHTSVDQQRYSTSSMAYERKRSRLPQVVELAKVPLYYRCSSLVPRELLAEEGAPFEEGVVKGWYCYECGKLNPQIHFRRRVCSSERCRLRTGPLLSQSEPPIGRGYALELQLVREPSQRLPLFLPANSVTGVKPQRSDWSDGMRTFTYQFRSDPPIKVAHVFTGNSPQRQAEQTYYFQKFQEEVELKRDISNDSKLSSACPRFLLTDNVVPYFTYRVGFLEDPWYLAPECVKESRRLLAFTAEAYGFLNSAASKVENLTVTAWMSPGAGSRKKARCLCITILTTERSATNRQNGQPRTVLW
jgi:hypothetical protein